MARPQKPVSLQTGNLTKEQQEQKNKQEEIIKSISAEQLNKSPAWLRDNTAKKEWKRLVEQFRELEVISNLDYNNLGAYCNAFSSYIELTNQLKEEEFTVLYINKFGAENRIENPILKIQIKFAEEMRKFSSLLGLTIDSRLKIATLKIEKIKKGTEEFGEI